MTRPPEHPELLSLAEGAELVGRAPETLRHAALRGALEAWRVGGRWVTTRAAVAAYAARVAEGPGWHNAPEARARREALPPL